MVNEIKGYIINEKSFVGLSDEGIRLETRAEGWEVYKPGLECDRPDRGISLGLGGYEYGRERKTGAVDYINK